MNLGNSRADSAILRLNNRQWPINPEKACHVHCGGHEKRSARLVLSDSFRVSLGFTLPGVANQSHFSRPQALQQTRFQSVDPRRDNT